MKENVKKAFDFASDASKQLITLSTGIIALTITFAKDILKDFGNESFNWLFWAWGFYILCVFSGVWAKLAMTGTLQPSSKKEKNSTSDINIRLNQITEEKEPHIYDRNIRIPFLIQVSSFVFGLVFTVIFGFKSIQYQNSNQNIETKNNKEIIRITEYQIVHSKNIDTSKTD
ncbi:hypothetical protein [Aquimarina sp. 2201CG5-10]|uniref:hypothetical protein n=1 Tax=Aquimarina callyspongiae TaxID=3098150 RepID=UPI002AB380AB|nr:hypothetical protein [Aquimarina sp. 2201CG5-10]MDY8136538.1 hypothetical protein [Aquimarina sp. 2201CG5-10]